MHSRGCACKEGVLTTVSGTHDTIRSLGADRTWDVQARGHGSSYPSNLSLESLGIGEPAPLLAVVGVTPLSVRLAPTPLVHRSGTNLWSMVVTLALTPPIRPLDEVKPGAVSARQAVPEIPTAMHGRRTRKVPPSGRRPVSKTGMVG